MNKESIELAPTDEQNVAVEWPAFAKKLTTVLRTLKDDEFLILSEKGTNHFVQFSEQGEDGMRVETTSNAYLQGAERLNSMQVAALKKAGWLPPTGNPSEATHDKDPDGSPNFFVQFPARRSCKTVVDLAVHTLTDILHVLHPGWLEYEAFNDEGTPIDLPSLGLQHFTRTVEVNRFDEMKLDVRNALRGETGLPGLEFDEDDTISLRRGSAAILVRMIFFPPYCVRLMSPLLHDCRESAELTARLNQMNADAHLMRFFTINHTVYAVADISADPLAPDQVRTMLDYFSSIANGVDTLLQKDFGGSTAHSTTAPSSLKH